MLFIGCVDKGRARGARGDALTNRTYAHGIILKVGRSALLRGSPRLVSVIWEPLEMGFLFDIALLDPKVLFVLRERTPLLTNDFRYFRVAFARVFCHYCRVVMLPIEDESVARSRDTRSGAWAETYVRTGGGQGERGSPWHLWDMLGWNYGCDGDGRVSAKAKKG